MILSILGKLPKLAKAIIGGDKSLLGRAIDAAKVITGMDNETDAVQALKSDPEKMYQYQMALLADKHIPDRLDLDNTKDARDMYKKTNHVRADEIADHVMSWNLPIIVVLVLLNIGVVSFVEGGALIAIASNFIGMAMKQLMSERQTIMNFFFGSSMGSKDKDMS